MAVVEATDLRNGGNASLRRQFSRPWSRCISPEGEVGPRLVVVRDVASENSPQMVLPENDHVVEGIPSALIRSHALRKGFARATFDS